MEQLSDASMHLEKELRGSMVQSWSLSKDDPFRIAAEQECDKRLQRNLSMLGINIRSILPTEICSDLSGLGVKRFSIINIQGLTRALVDTLLCVALSVEEHEALDRATEDDPELGFSFYIFTPSPLHPSQKPLMMRPDEFEKYLARNEMFEELRAQIEEKRSKIKRA